MLLLWWLIDLCCLWCAVTTTALMLSFNDLHDLPLQRIPSTVPCSVIFGSVSWRQTWPSSCDDWQLTIRTPDVQRGQWPVAILFVSFVFLVWYAKYPPVAFLFKGFIYLLDSPRQICSQRPALTFDEQYWQDIQFNICRTRSLPLLGPCETPGHSTWKSLQIVSLVVIKPWPNY